MLDADRIEQLLDTASTVGRSLLSEDQPKAERILSAARDLDRAWSGSSLGHHAEIYTYTLEPPRTGKFNVEFGTIRGMPQGWCRWDSDKITERIASKSGVDLSDWQKTYESKLASLEACRDDILIEFSLLDDGERALVKKLLTVAEALDFSRKIRNETIVSKLNATRAKMSRDARAITAGGVITPAHIFYEAIAQEVQVAQENLEQLTAITRRVLRTLELSSVYENTQVGENTEMSLAAKAIHPFQLRKNDGGDVAFKGLLTGELLITLDTKVPFEVSDSIERVLPNGLTERFMVVDPKFFPAMRTIQAHFQITLRRLRQAETSDGRSSSVVNIYNLQGHNTRVNLNSNDSSSNVTNIGEQELFQKLKDALSAAPIASDQLKMLHEDIAAMQSTAGSTNFPNTFQRFMGNATACAKVIAPFLPALTQLLTASLGS